MSTKDESKQLIRFDWAIKYILRDRANFDVLEGFLGALLEEDDLQILELIGEEGGQEKENEKFNRVDLLVKDSQDRRIIIEVQTTRETDYLERLLFGTCKSIIEHIGSGQRYKNIYKVISVSVLFFNLGRGDDYLYHGTTQFLGMNDGKPLIIKRKEEIALNGEKSYRFVEKNIFPEYYLIRVEKYSNIVQRRIDEWIYMIKNNEIKEGSSAKNIDKAAEKLALLNMNKKEKKAYENYLIDLEREKDILVTAREEGEKQGEKTGLEKGEKIGLEKGEKIGLEKGEKIGLEKGEKIGLEKGEYKKAIDTACSLKKMGILSDEQIAQATGLSVEEVTNLKC
ncbi:MAG: Rpn family recombination-promoting nuclease/putative transposase [Bacteroidota bacterium]